MNSNRLLYTSYSPNSFLINSLATLLLALSNLLAVFTFFCIFFFFRFVDYKRLINHYNSVFIEKKAHADGILLSINKQTITLDDNIRVKELIFEIDGNKSTYYLLTMFDTSKLEINQKYHLLLADNFIEKINYEI